MPPVEEWDRTEETLYVTKYTWASIEFSAEQNLWLVVLRAPALFAGRLEQARTTLKLFFQSHAALTCAPRVRSSLSTDGNQVATLKLGPIYGRSLSKYLHHNRRLDEAVIVWLARQHLAILAILHTEGLSNFSPTIESITYDPATPACTFLSWESLEVSDAYCAHDLASAAALWVELASGIPAPRVLFERRFAAAPAMSEGLHTLCADLIAGAVNLQDAQARLDALDGLWQTPAEELLVNAKALAVSDPAHCRMLVDLAQRKGASPSQIDDVLRRLGASEAERVQEYLRDAGLNLELGQYSRARLLLESALNATGADPALMLRAQRWQCVAQALHNMVQSTLERRKSVREAEEALLAILRLTDQGQTAQASEHLTPLCDDLLAEVDLPTLMALRADLAFCGQMTTAEAALESGDASSALVALKQADDLLVNLSYRETLLRNMAAPDQLHKRLAQQIADRDVGKEHLAMAQRMFEQGSFADAMIAVRNAAERLALADDDVLLCIALHEQAAACANMMKTPAGGNPEHAGIDALHHGLAAIIHLRRRFPNLPWALEQESAWQHALLRRFAVWPEPALAQLLLATWPDDVSVGAMVLEQGEQQLQAQQGAVERIAAQVDAILTPALVNQLRAQLADARHLAHAQQGWFQQIESLAEDGAALLERIDHLGATLDKRGQHLVDLRQEYLHARDDGRPTSALLQAAVQARLELFDDPAHSVERLLVEDSALDAQLATPTWRYLLRAAFSAWDQGLAHQARLAFQNALALSDMPPVERSAAEAALAAIEHGKLIADAELGKRVTSMTRPQQAQPVAHTTKQQSPKRRTGCSWLALALLLLTSMILIGALLVGLNTDTTRLWLATLQTGWASWLGGANATSEPAHPVAPIHAPIARMDPGLEEELPAPTAARPQPVLPHLSVVEPGTIDIGIGHAISIVVQLDEAIRRVAVVAATSPPRLLASAANTNTTSLVAFPNPQGMAVISVVGVAVGDGYFSARLITSSAFVSLPLTVRPVARLRRASNLRTQPVVPVDPGANIGAIGKANESLPLMGRIADNTWWLVRTPVNELLWVADMNVVVNGDTTQVPMIPEPADAPAEGTEESGG